MVGSHTEPPSTSVTAEQPALEGRESTILTCSAHGGCPDTHNLTWTKDGVVLARGRGTTLNYSTLSSFSNPFGRYVCTVESLYSSEEKSLLIQEKGMGNCNQEPMNIMALMNSCYTTIVYMCNFPVYSTRYSGDLAVILVFSIIADTNGPWKY